MQFESMRYSIRTVKSRHPINNAEEDNSKLQAVIARYEEI